jgi:hypothetical protein
MYLYRRCTGGARLVAKVFAGTGDLDRVLILVIRVQGVHEHSSVPAACWQCLHDATSPCIQQRQRLLLIIGL